ncbi:MAG: EAL domain-containing protein [Chloroflexota bacterium]
MKQSKVIESPRAADYHRLDHCATIIVSRDGTIIGWSEAATAMLGHREVDALGSSISDLLIPTRLWNVYRDTIYGDPPHVSDEVSNPCFPIVVQTAGKDEIPLLVTRTKVAMQDADGFALQLRLVDDDAGGDFGAGVLGEDIRGRIDLPVAAVFITTPEAQAPPLYVSPQINDLLGFNQREWIENEEIWRESLYPEGAVDHVPLVRSEGAEHIEYQVQRRNGRTIWLHQKATMIRDEAGEPLCIQGTLLDVTHRREIDAAADEARERYRSLVEETPAVTFRTAHTEHAELLYVSSQLQALLGYVPEEWIEHPTAWAETIHPDDLDTVFDEIRKSWETEEGFSLEFRMRSAGGQWVSVQCTAGLVRDADGTPLYWQGVFVDITRTKEIEQRHDALQRRYLHLLENAGDVIVVIDRDRSFSFVNRAFSELTGYSAEEVSDLFVDHLVHPDDLDRVIARLVEISAAVEPGDQAPFRVITANGQVVTVEPKATPVWAAGEVVGVQAILRDVTEAEDLQQRLMQKAYTDDLTGLANRAQFEDELNRALNSGARCAVLFMDLDNFKLINDTMGHQAGDEFLVEMSRRIASAVRRNDLVARFGGDEFAVLIRELLDEDDADQAAARLLNSLREPIDAGGREFSLTGSVGIAISDESIRDADDLLRRADLAMYAAKAQGKDVATTYHRVLETAVHNRMELENDLKTAIDDDQLEIQYQPIVDLQDGTASGVEALVRWRHPDRGLLHARDFIPIAEGTGIITEIDTWVLKQIVRERDRWLHLAPGDHPLISVNMSCRQMERDDLLSILGPIVDELRQIPSRPQLLLELREQIFKSPNSDAPNVLEEMHNLGIMTAIDDFGMGYASLVHVREQPVDYLKIDDSLMRDVSGGDVEQIITTSMIELAHALGLRVIAEGIETADQAQLLRTLGCDFAQGYLYCPEEDAGAGRLSLDEGFIVPDEFLNLSASLGR